MTKKFLHLILFPISLAQELFAPSKLLSVFVSLLTRFEYSLLTLLFKLLSEYCQSGKWEF